MDRRSEGRERDLGEIRRDACLIKKDLKFPAFPSKQLHTHQTQCFEAYCLERPQGLLSSNPRKSNTSTLVPIGTRVVPFDPAILADGTDSVELCLLSILNLTLVASDE